MLLREGETACSIKVFEFDAIAHPSAFVGPSFRPLLAALRSPLKASTAFHGISRAMWRVAPLDALLGKPVRAHRSLVVRFTPHSVPRLRDALNMVADEWSGKAVPPSVGEFSLPTL
jgi:hypothetical protein